MKPKTKKRRLNAAEKRLNALMFGLFIVENAGALAEMVAAATADYDALVKALEKADA